MTISASINNRTITTFSLFHLEAPIGRWGGAAFILQRRARPTIAPVFQSFGGEPPFPERRSFFIPPAARAAHLDIHDLDFSPFDFGVVPAAINSRAKMPPASSCQALSVVAGYFGSGWPPFIICSLFSLCWLYQNDFVTPAAAHFVIFFLRGADSSNGRFVVLGSLAVHHALCVASRARERGRTSASGFDPGDAELWGLFGSSRSKPLAAGQKAGLTDPLMDEIEKLFTSAG